MSITLRLKGKYGIIKSGGASNEKACVMDYGFHSYAGSLHCPQEERYLPKLVPEEEFSEELYQALSADWAAYDALSWENQMALSHLPGWCSRDFDDWEAVEQLVGMTIPNPLEKL